MSRFALAWIAVLLCLTSASLVYAQDDVEPKVCDVRIHNEPCSRPSTRNFSDYEESIDKIKEELHRLEVELAKLSHVEGALGDVKREMTDSLMEIANVLAVADRNLDAANTALDAADTAIAASNSYLQWTAGLMAAFAILATFLTFYYTAHSTQKEARLAERLVRKLHSSGGKSIIEEIKASIHDELRDDAEGTVSWYMQSEETLKRFEKMIDKAVEQKLKEAPGKNSQFEFTDDDQ